ERPGAPGFDGLKSILDHALGELRAVAAGLRLPELQDLSLPDAVRRVARGHERRTRTEVRLRFQDLLAPISVPVKITVCRLVQEALSNAYRHGGGIAQEVEVSGNIGT